MRVDLKVLAACFIAVFLTAAIGSLFTMNEVKSSWYESIRPSITPPNWVFPIAWTIIFFLIFLALYYSWTNAGEYEKKKVMNIYGLNFLLNILWSALFFGLKNPGLALFEMALLWVSIALMVYVSYKIDRKAGYLLVPYILWVTFAMLLNLLSII